MLDTASGSGDALVYLSYLSWQTYKTDFTTLTVGLKDILSCSGYGSQSEVQHRLDFSLFDSSKYVYIFT